MQGAQRSGEAKVLAAQRPEGQEVSATLAGGGGLIHAERLRECGAERLPLMRLAGAALSGVVELGESETMEPIKKKVFRSDGCDYEGKKRTCTSPRCPRSRRTPRCERADGAAPAVDVSHGGERSGQKSERLLLARIIMIVTRVSVGVCGCVSWPACLGMRLQMASDKDWYRILRGMLRPPVCRGRMRHKPFCSAA